MTVRPATSDRQRPSLAKKDTRATKAKREEALNQGFAVTDPLDGARLSVRLGDVRGVHEAQLRGVCGLGFMELLVALQSTPSLDLLAASIWFARLVNGRKPGDYMEQLEEISYADVEGLDFDEATGQGDSPEA
jgi:hypothetical protein